MLFGYVISFLLTGLWVSIKVHNKKLLPKEFLYLGSLAASLLIYYILFYIYLVSPDVAAIITLLFIALSPLILFLLITGCLKSSKQFPLIKRYYFPPLLITFFILIIYSSIFYGCTNNKSSYGGYKEVSNQSFCHIQDLPFDNALPFIYADNILNNQDDKKALSWNLVDRPPLQIAATLPIEYFSEGQNQYLRFFYYHVFSVFLQLFWVGALWGILQRLKIRKKAQACIIISFSATGFFYLNSVFVWPKLLAAGLVVSGLLLFIGNKQRRLPFNYMPFAAILISLGLLSHGGIIFTLIPFVFLLLYKIVHLPKINYKYLSISILLLFSILLPWQLYKDSLSNSDRLVKYHFAGVQTAQDKRGTLETITDQYKKLDFKQWLHYKTQNTRTIITGNYNLPQDCPLRIRTLLKDCTLSQWRALTFFSTFFALEIFIAGFFMILYALIKRRLDTFDKDVIFIVASSLILWIFVMFEAGSTLVHQGSYANMLLIFILLGKYLSKLPVWIFASITLLQVFIFYLVWVNAFNII